MKKGFILFVTILFLIFLSKIILFDLYNNSFYYSFLEKKQDFINMEFKLNFYKDFFTKNSIYEDLSFEDNGYIINIKVTNDKLQKIEIFIQKDNISKYDFILK